MASVLPHSSVTRKNVDDYVDDAVAHVNSQVAALKASGAFRNIYKSTLSIDCLLSKAPKTARPTSGVLRGVVQQIPTMVALTSQSSSKVQLRRFIECVFWMVYFADHPVEWNEFESDPSRRIEKDLTKPISFCAHREPSFYRHYAKERMLDEPSGLALSAIDELGGEFANLSAAAHGTSAVRKGKLYPPLSDIDESNISKFADKYRMTIANCAIVVAALFRPQFDKLPPVHRAWFDWLIGPTQNKKLRSGPFGLR